MPRAPGSVGRPPGRPSGSVGRPPGRPAGSGGRPAGSVGRPPGRPPKVAGNRGTNGDSDSGTSESEGPKNTPSHSYTAPQWLLQGGKQAPKFFSVPIPAVPPAMLKAVQAQVVKGTPNKKSTKQSVKFSQQLQQLQQDQQSQSEKVDALKKKLAASRAAKEQGLADIRSVREEEIEDAMKEIEKRMRAQHEKKCKEQDENLRKEVAEKIEKEFEEQQKKKKLEEEETKSEEEDVKSTEEPESKKQKLEKGKLKSEEIQEQLDEVPKKLDKLTEAKSEMVWLLKQVIKADTKRKMEVMKKRKMGAMKN